MEIANHMKSTKELLELCDKIAGITIYELADFLKIIPPESLNKNKGWVGQLLEQYLGATGGNLPITDFPHLGTELKTIPVNPTNLHPLESTFICTATLKQPTITWEQSTVKLKLSNVLWLPIESSCKINLIKRRIGKAFLWQPNIHQTAILKQDWQELTEIMQLGHIKLLSAKYGRYLQIRPKAANCKNNLAEYITRDGESIKTVTRGFYLRTSFTKTILANYFVC